MFLRKILLITITFCGLIRGVDVGFFGSIGEFADGDKFDAFVNRYFRANFGENGIAYLDEVATLPHRSGEPKPHEKNIGAKLVGVRSTNSPEDIEFKKKLKLEISEIVSNFQRLDFFNSGQKALGTIKPDVPSAVEADVHYRLHRIIGLLDYLKTHDWRFSDNNWVSFSANVDEQNRKELKNLLVKFRPHFSGTQDKMPKRFYTNSLKLIGMLSWPGPDVQPRSVFKFLDDMFAATKGVGQPQNQPIEDIRYTVLSGILQKSIGNDGITSLEDSDERLQFFRTISSQLLFTGFSIPFSNLSKKCAENYPKSVLNFGKSYTDLIRIISVLVKDGQDYKTKIGSIENPSDCKTFTQPNALMIFVTKTNCFVKSLIPAPVSTTPGESCELKPKAQTSTPTNPPPKPKECVDIETLTNEINEALKVHKSSILEQ